MNNQKTFFKAKRDAASLIQSHHLDPDVARYLMCAEFSFSNTDLLMHYHNLMSEQQLSAYWNNIRRFIQGEPPQYIMQKAPFYGHEFIVNHHVLIPRMETEELVDWVLKSFNKQPLKVIDIGTGSGAIAISLKIARPNWHVFASDISGSALEIAKQNAEKYQTKINFVKSNVFQALKVHDFDVVISNPPYIAQNEIQYMDNSVLEYEPHLALFAKNNGLAMYKSIAQHVKSYTKKHAVIFLEIGFKQKISVNRISKRYLSNVQIENRDDISKHPRMVKISY